MPYHHAENRNSLAIVNCHKCKDKVTEIQNYLECDGCQKYFHLRCAGIAGINITRASFSDTWFCKDCKLLTPDSLKRKAAEISPEGQRNMSYNNKKTNNQETPKKSTVSDNKLDFIIKQLNIMNADNKELKDMVSTVQENQQFLSDQIDTLKKKIDNACKDNEKLKKDVNYIQTKQNEHTTQINNLEAEMDVLKQLNLANNVVIGGIPHNVDPITVISNIMKTLNTQCEISDVDDVYFLYNKTNKTTPNSTPQLLVKFKSINAKEEIISKKKQKRTLLCNEIGLNTSADKQIYIRDHVTSFKMGLFNECKAIKNKLNWEYLWMDGSKILMRKQGNSKVHSITSRNDLNKIVITKSIVNVEPQSLYSQAIEINNTGTGTNTT